MNRGSMIWGYMGVSLNGGTPIAGWCRIENSIQMDDLGVPLFFGNCDIGILLKSTQYVLFQYYSTLHFRWMILLQAQSRVRPGDASPVMEAFHNICLEIWLFPPPHNKVCCIFIMFHPYLRFHCPSLSSGMMTIDGRTRSYVSLMMEIQDSSIPPLSIEFHHIHNLICSSIVPSGNQTWQWTVHHL